MSEWALKASIRKTSNRSTVKMVNERTGEEVHLPCTRIDVSQCARGAAHAELHVFIDQVDVDLPATGVTVVQSVVDGGEVEGGE